MTPETKIPVVLKEYEALRKEIDARTDATKNYGWPVVAVAFAAIVGWKSDNFDFNIASILAPVIAMTIYALAANANHSIDRARVDIALVEDRIFALSGSQVLICSESLRLKGWREDSAKRWLLEGVLPIIIYIIVEVCFFLLLPKASWDKIWSNDFPSGFFLLLGVILAPLVIYFLNTVMRYRVRSKAPCTELMKSDGFIKIYRNYKPCSESLRQQ